VLVSAALDTAGRTGSLGEVVQYPNAAASQMDRSRQRLAQMAAANSDAELVFVDAGGRELSSYALASLDGVPHEDGDPTTEQFTITEWFDLPDGATAIRLMVGGTTVAERRASANPPQVSLDQPGGGKLQAPLTVRWTASDPDGDELRATLLYSADDGKTWEAMATFLPGNEVTLGSLQHMAGSKEGRLKVVVTDGFHTAEAVTANRLEVPNSAPRPGIVGPKDGGTFPFGATVILQGSAFDVEDLGLEGDRLVWTSNLDGKLGEGSEVMVDDLQPGTHTIKLNAKDSDGASGSAQITLIIEDGPGHERPSKDEERLLLQGLGAPTGDSNASWYILGAAIAGAIIALGGAAVWASRRATD
jgi:hypothetical protein